MIKCIFTDCFDTLVIRREHPFQIEYRWAQSMSRLYPLLTPDVLYKDRKKYASPKVLYNGIYDIYNKLADIYYEKGFVTDRQEFLNDSILLELKCELSSAKINTKVAKFLMDYKKKGVKVVCVSDYHLSSDDLKRFILSLGIDWLDGVYSSASFAESKEDGKLYNEVLKQLNLNPEECLMIGDNRLSDIKNAKANGIHAKYFSNNIHKNALRLKNKFSISSSSIKTVSKKYLDSDCYEEYSMLLYTFCVRLYNVASENKFKKIIFLAREGGFLKRCFEEYQLLCVPKDYRIKSEYLKLSRRAIHSVQKDKCMPDFFGEISVINYFKSIGFTEEEARIFAKNLGIDNPDMIENFAISKNTELIWEKYGTLIDKRISENKNAFSEYLHSIAGRDKKILIVDVGWTGRMQQGIEVLFDEYSTVGCYMGIYDNLLDEPNVERHGLIFNKSEDGKLSRFYNIFRANTQLYEQLLSGAHGSACFYLFDEFRNPYVVEEWDRQEKGLYFDVIKDLQDKLIMDLGELCTYTFDGIESDCYTRSKFNKQLAEIMLYSSLVQSSERTAFMKRLIKGFSQNFQQQSNGMKFSASGIDDNFINIIIHPDRFVRYVSKFAVAMDKYKLGGGARFVMRMYYVYNKMFLLFL